MNIISYRYIIRGVTKVRRAACGLGVRRAPCGVLRAAWNNLVTKIIGIRWKFPTTKVCLGYEILRAWKNKGYEIIFFHPSNNFMDFFFSFEGQTLHPEWKIWKFAWNIRFLHFFNQVYHLFRARLNSKRKEYDFFLSIIRGTKTYEEKKGGTKFFNEKIRSMKYFKTFEKNTLRPGSRCKKRLAPNKNRHTTRKRWKHR